MLRANSEKTQQSTEKTVMKDKESSNNATETTGSNKGSLKDFEVLSLIPLAIAIISLVLWARFLNVYRG